MKTLSAGERSVIKATTSALLADRTNQKDFHHIKTKFSELLKTNFENRNIWLRFGLTISLSGDSPHSALQAYNECIRIDQDDPLPAMLAAKLTLECLDDPERGLDFIDEAIKRCNKLLCTNQETNNNNTNTNHNNQTKSSGDTSPTKKTKSLDDVGKADSAKLANNSLASPSQNVANSSPKSSQSSISHRNLQNQTQLTDKVAVSNISYKDINPLLSRCYLLASIMHAYIYEREPESIKQFKLDNLKASLQYLDLASETNANDHLIYFHKALHQVKQRTYPMAVDNLRKALQLSPHHIPTMQLLILSLSAMKFYSEALLLCESTLYEYEDDLLLLYIKCNLEQSLVESKGYKTALNTAQYILRCLRKAKSTKDDHINANKTHSSTTTISAAAQSLQQQQQLQNHQPSDHQQAHQSQQQTTSGSISNSVNARDSSAVANTTPVLSTSSNQAGDTKQTNNLFSEDALGQAYCKEFPISELSMWLLVAEIFVKIGSYEDAEMCVDESSLHTSGALSHKIMYMRGLIAKARDNLTEAKTFFQSCLALCPRHAKALQQVAHVHYLLGNFTTAQKFLMDSLDSDGDCFKTWHYLSLVFMELNQHDKASECEKKSTALEESSPVVTFSAIPRLTLQ